MKIKNISVCVAAAMTIVSGANYYSGISSHGADYITVVNLNETSTFRNHTRELVGEKYRTAISYGESLGYEEYGDYYDVTASTRAPYHQGVLKNSTIKAMESMTNYYRWLAGTNPLEKPCVKSEYLQYQALDRNFQFDHRIDQSSKPSDMPQSLWDKGFELNHNILALGYTPRGAITGWLNEGYNTGSKSWDTLGHRYAIISPSTGSIQYGFSGRIAIGDITGYTSNSDTYCMFPSPGAFPSECISQYESAWSADFPSDLYTSQDSTVTVKIINLSTGATMNRSTANDTVHASSGHVVFAQPDDVSYYNSKYKVQIDGLRKGSEKIRVEYTVDFFDPYSSFGDINNDGAVNSLDASVVLGIYADSATGKPVNLDKNRSWQADVTRDGEINALDASKILEYYSYTATGGTTSFYYFNGNNVWFW